MIEALMEPWGWGDWFWRGVLASSLAAVSLAIVGVFMYLRRMSLIADALAHVALPGIVVVFLLTGSMAPPQMLAGAAAAGIFAAWLIEYTATHRRVRSDAAIGVVFTALFALGVILLSTVARNAHLDTECVLFGDVLGISDGTLWMLGGVAATVVGLTAVFFRWLELSSFDARMAAAVGIPVVGMHYGLMTTVSLASAAAFEAVGAILSIALMIVPAATAHLLTDRLLPMLGVAVLHALASSVVGFYASVWVNASTSGMIVVTGGALYVLAFCFAPRHGRLWGGWRWPGRDAGLEEVLR